MATIADLLIDGPTRVMAIVNVTPDSFAEQVHRGVDQAIKQGFELWEQGADLIDVGGQSSRPGAAQIGLDEELVRVVPVIEALASAGVAVSVDTMRSGVAAAAIRAGAIMVNDVSGGLADPDMVAMVAREPVGYVLQHWRKAFDHESSHVDVVSEVCSELAERTQVAIDRGVDPNRLVIDPGIGFGKTTTQNWELIAHPYALAELGFPVLWGVSRKSVLAGVFETATKPWQRDAAGVALTTCLAQHAVWAVRTHTVSDHRAAIAVVESLLKAQVGQR